MKVFRPPVIDIDESATRRSPAPLAVGEQGSPANQSYCMPASEIRSYFVATGLLRVSPATRAGLLKPRGAAGARADEKEVTAVYCRPFCETDLAGQSRCVLGMSKPKIRGRTIMPLIKE